VDETILSSLSTLMTIIAKEAKIKFLTSNGVAIRKIYGANIEEETNISINSLYSEMEKNFILELEI